MASFTDFCGDVSHTTLVSAQKLPRRCLDCVVVLSSLHVPRGRLPSGC